MKKSVLYIFIACLNLVLFTACEKDDTDFSAYDFSSYSLDSESDDDEDDGADTDGMVIYINFSNGSATVTGDDKGYVSVSNADVVVNDPTAYETAEGLTLVLSGSTSDGSLLVYRNKKYTIQLNNVTIHNADGPAINNQCSKSLYVQCLDGTTNTLSDGTAYTDVTDSEGIVIDQKGTLFSEGQVYFSGAGTLNVTANCKNAIAADDYLTIESDITINTTTSTTGSNGVKANDGVFINGGVLNVEVNSLGGRGIRSEAETTITGGTVNITTTGDCEEVYNETTFVYEYSSAACIRSTGVFTLSGGTVTLSSSGDGGKGINCDADVIVTGGSLVATTTGTKNNAKPKAVKSDTNITLSGGYFEARVANGWACDNATDSSDPAGRVTIVGTPTTSSIAKQEVIVSFE